MSMDPETDDMNKCKFAVVFVLLVVGLAQMSHAASAGTGLQAVLEKIAANDIVPGAQGYGPVDVAMSIAPALKDGELTGYVFLNTDFDRAIGYSGKPIKILIGLDMSGRITGAKLVEHSEPIVLAGIPDHKIVSFIDGYTDLNIVEAAKETGATAPPVDIVSGATVTVLVIDDSIRNSAISAARALGLGGLTAESAKAQVVKTLDTSSTKIRDWLGLIGDGSVRRLKLSVGDINTAFAKTGNEKAIALPESGADDELFIELFAASLAIPTIAKSLLGEAEYAHLQKRLKPGQHAFLIMGNGRFSFKGSGYVRGGIFDRVQLVQNRTSIRFRDRGHKRIRKIGAQGAPSFHEAGIFSIPKDAAFDPAWPWRLQLLVPRVVGAIDKVFTSFELSYRLPDQYVMSQTIAAEARPAQSVSSAPTKQVRGKPELWQRIWHQKIVQVVVLCLAIALLTVIFFFQNHLVKYPRLTRHLRNAFLLFTLVWIGWYAQAQLSVVNVFVFANALIGDFRWEHFLLEPLIFILWCSVAASLLFWGRGAFCGWLCPFGALQELLNQVARKLKFPQYRLPWGLHERLWPLKYLMLMALLGYSIYSLSGAEKLAEIEPFKTAIVLRFMRDWPFVLFAVALLAVGLFVERFYCRYLCPLGAALAIPGRLTMFDWLKRYRNCGDPCHLCAQDCMVQAITPMGDINPNECLHCLHCQVMYFDNNVCPVMILKKTKASKTDRKPADADALETAESLYRRPRRLSTPRTIEPKDSVGS